MRKNKRGDFSLIGGKTIGILIALLCILLLFYLGYKIATVREQYENKKRAEAILNEIDIISKTMQNIGDSKNYIIPSLNNWMLYSSYQNHPKPLQCDEKECLCLCPKAEDDQIVLSCYNYGACRQQLTFKLKGWEGREDLTLLVGAPIEQQKTNAEWERRAQQQSEIRIRKTSNSDYELAYIDKGIEIVEKKEELSKSVTQLDQTLLKDEYKNVNSAKKYPGLAIDYTYPHDDDGDIFLFRWNSEISKPQVLITHTGSDLGGVWFLDPSFDKELRFDLRFKDQQNHVLTIMNAKNEREFIERIVNVAKKQLFYPYEGADEIHGGNLVIKMSLAMIKPDFTSNKDGSDLRESGEISSYKGNLDLDSVSTELYKKEGLYSAHLPSYSEKIKELFVINEKVKSEELVAPEWIRLENNNPKELVFLSKDSNNKLIIEVSNNPDGSKEERITSMQKRQADGTYATIDYLRIASTEKK